MILFIHAFSECDTTSVLFCQGKAKFCSLIEKHQYLFCSLIEKHQYLKTKLQIFLNHEATIDQVAKTGELSLIHLYRGNFKYSASDLNDLRYQLFTKSATKARSSLERLTPTNDAARFHALRLYFQVQNWLRNEKILSNGVGNKALKECRALVGNALDIWCLPP
ncbi:hypothetical protein JTE90_004393 [Oedothorax gibbosus]|uniref:Uncharacterized protein n=1 Tax=Oedothorax gibbosus TaxID=931172 RepID=A0AAV6URE5_9ARAC|nr:hypothetical protein JTE90_004393 [Oedothorax gibbosus]